jgi:hypothetical protein
LARQVGDFARHAQQGFGWPVTLEDGAPGTLVRFSSLNFIIATDGRLVRVQAPVSPVNNDAIVDSLQSLRLQSREQGVPAVSSSNAFESTCLEYQL